VAAEAPAFSSHVNRPAPALAGFLTASQIAAVGLGLASLTPVSVRAQTEAAPAAATTADDAINPDRPGIADGSNVVGPGRFQIEVGLQGEFRHPDATSERTLFIPTLLRLGLSKAWELRVETTGAYIWDRVSDPATGVTRSEGSDPISLGVKYHFQDGAGPRQPSLGAILRVFAPSGSGPFKTSHTTADLRLAADWDIAPKWSLNPNVGVAVYEAAGRTYEAGLFAATLNYNPSPILNLFVDTGVQGPETKNGGASVIFDAGVAYIIGHDIQLDASVGTGATGATPPHPFVSAGISKRF
jgi:hypothetical protein